jgi:hypothetical protein
MKPAVREVLAFAVWLPFALPPGIAYARFLIELLGRNMGMTGGAIVFLLPVAVAIVAVAIWLPVWSFFRRQLQRRLGWLSLPLAAALAAAFVLVLCGVSCFSPVGSDPYLAYFLIVPCAIAGWLHDRLSSAWLARPDEAA